MFIADIPELDGAACAETANPDAFFSYEDWETEQAREICRRCPAIRDCLAWALTHKEHGIWAGTTPEQRDALRRRHAMKEPA